MIENGKFGDPIRSAATRRQAPKDIETEGKFIPTWDPTQPAKSLAQIHSYVIGEASRAKCSKARPSQMIRLLAWILAAVSGLLPVIGYLFKSHIPGGLQLSDGLWASLLLGVAASLFGLGKAFGYSSGWARYVLTATNIRRALEEFRMD